jgi:hypothetical protein
MPFKTISLVFVLAAFALLAPVRSAPAFQARQYDATSSAPQPAASAASVATPDFVKQNGLDAQILNAQFANAKPDASCQGALGFFY